MTNPRLSAAELAEIEAIWEQVNHLRLPATLLIDAVPKLLAHIRALGTSTEAQVEAAARTLHRVLYEDDPNQPAFDELDGTAQEFFRKAARAALTAAQEKKDV